MIISHKLSLFQAPGNASKENIVSCTSIWLGLDVCVAGQPTRTNLISSIPDHLGRPFSTRRRSLNSIHEDFEEEMPKVPH